MYTHTYLPTVHRPTYLHLHIYQPTYSIPTYLQHTDLPTVYRPTYLQYTDIPTYSIPTYLPTYFGSKHGASRFELYYSELYSYFGSIISSL